MENFRSQYPELMNVPIESLETRRQKWKPSPALKVNEKLKEPYMVGWVVGIYGLGLWVMLFCVLCGR